MPDYVVGFAFGPNKNAVVLVCKTHPDWQAGLLNGIGGKVNAGETHAQAMVREYKEEAGVETDPECWQPVVEMEYPGGVISFFRTFDPDAYHLAKTMTDEEVVPINLGELSEYRCVANINWILPLCIHADASASGSRMQLPVRIVEEMVEGMR